MKLGFDVLEKKFTLSSNFVNLSIPNTEEFAAALAVTVEQYPVRCPPVILTPPTNLRINPTIAIYPNYSVSVSWDSPVGLNYPHLVSYIVQIAPQGNTRNWTTVANNITSTTFNFDVRQAYSNQGLIRVIAKDTGGRISAPSTAIRYEASAPLYDFF